MNISQQRLHSLGLTHSTLKSPQEAVHWLVAAQAQDFAGAKWSLGLRIPNSTESLMDHAFETGDILRTHLLRPTWHFVSPPDIRWLLQLTAPRVHAVNAFMYRKMELDSAIFKRSNKALEKSLQGGKHLTRDELRDSLEKGGIRTEGEQRMSYLLMRAELDGLICSGPRKGRQFGYMLLEERVPQTANLTRDEALLELTQRYFRSRGPATLHDFSKWSGLTMADAKHGLEAVKSQFQNETINGQSYWFQESTQRPKSKSPTLHLLSIFDEYISSYKDRSAMVNEKDGEKLKSMGNDLTYVIVLDGQIIGTWKRVQGKSVVIKPNFFRTLKKGEKQAFVHAAEGYGHFLELPLEFDYK
jgi:hypothetical protein